MRIINIFIVFVLVIFQTGLSYAGSKEMDLGEQLFLRYCAQCHGEKGLGDGKNSKGLDPAPRDLSDAIREGMKEEDQKYLAKKDNAHLIKVINEGGLGIEKSGLMPAFKNTFSPYETVVVVSYIRTLHPNDAPPVDFSKAPKTKPKNALTTIDVAGDASKREKMMGKKIYKKYGCSGCHAINERGGTSGPSLSTVGARLDAKKVWQVIKDPASVNGESKMPAYNLDEMRGKILVKYLSSLQE